MHNLSVEERKTLLANINHNLLTGCQTLGQAARRIRTELCCMSQTRYAAFIGISEKNLLHFAQDYAEYTYRHY